MSTIELDEDYEVSERYESMRARPLVQIGMRFGLWAAVAVGAVGGAMGLFRSPEAAPVPAEASPADQLGVPAPVAGVAESAVEAWYTADPRVADLFVSPPNLEGYDAEGLTVLAARTVAGQQVQEGFWAVTVEVVLQEPAPQPRPDGEQVGGDTGTEGDTADHGDEDVLSDEEAEPPPATVVYVQLSVVGDMAKRLQALTTPAVLPAPPAVGDQWQAAGPRPKPPEGGDPVAEAVQGFLDGLLAGGSDPDRYVAPGVVMTPADPPLFAELEVDSIGREELADGKTWVRADVLATTAADRTQRLSYDLILGQRDGRWEIQLVSPVLAESRTGS